MNSEEMERLLPFELLNVIAQSLEQMRVSFKSLYPEVFILKSAVSGL